MRKYQLSNAKLTFASKLTRVKILDVGFEDIFKRVKAPLMAHPALPTVLHLVVHSKSWGHFPPWRVLISCEGINKAAGVRLKGRSSGRRGVKAVIREIYGRAISG